MSGMAKTNEETRLEIHEIITEILVTLSVDETTNDDEVAVFEEEMGNIASVILDSLNLVVTSAEVGEDGTTSLTALMSYENGDPITQEEMDTIIG
jgi:hypothetical protein